MDGFFKEDLLERLAWLDVSPEIADLLEYLATAEDEAKASALNEFRYAEFLDSYRTYVRRWRDCENSLSEGFSLSM